MIRKESLSTPGIQKGVVAAYSVCEEDHLQAKQLRAGLHVCVQTVCRKSEAETILFACGIFNLRSSATTAERNIEKRREDRISPYCHAMLLKQHWTAVDASRAPGRRRSLAR